jgi:hypothetical protein
MRSVTKLYSQHEREQVQADSNTSTLDLRVVGGDKKEPSAWGYNWVNLFLGDINRGPDHPGSISLAYATVKYGQEFSVTRAGEN